MNDVPQSARIVITVDGEPACTVIAKQKGSGILSMEVQRSLYLNAEATAIVVLLLAHELVPDPLKPKCLSMAMALSEAELAKEDDDIPW